MFYACGNIGGRGHNLITILCSNCKGEGNLCESQEDAAPNCPLRSRTTPILPMVADGEPWGWGKKIGPGEGEWLALRNVACWLAGKMVLSLKNVLVTVTDHIVDFLLLLGQSQLCLYPPLVLATQKSQINTVPTPPVAWTRPQTPRFKKRGLHGELVQERGI